MVHISMGTYGHPGVDLTVITNSPDRNENGIAVRSASVPEDHLCSIPKDLPFPAGGCYQELRPEQAP